MSAAQAIKLEYAALQACPRGLYVTPASDSTWHGVIFVQRGHYAGGVFRFELDLSHYPTSRPAVTFTTSVFHPLIDAASGQLSLEGRFPTWRQGETFLSHLLHFIKACFKRPVLDNLQEATCINKEAYRLYRDQTSLFAQLAAQSAELSTTEGNIYGPTKRPTPLRFSRLSTDEEMDARARIGLT